MTGKLQAGSIRIGGPKKDNTWKYLSKFGYAIGRGTYSVRIQLAQPNKIKQDAKIELEVFLDEDWPDIENVEYCKRKERMRHARELKVQSSGNWSEWVHGTLRQTVRPHIWYFALSDCNASLQNFTHRFRFEFKALQEDESHFSIEMRWMLSVNLLALSGLTGFMAIFVQRSKAFWRSAGSVHPVIWTLASAMIIQYSAQFLHTLHLFRYRSDGQGLRALEVLSEIFFMLSQVIQTSLLILIGLGYTLLQSKIGELDLMIPMCFMIAVIHIMLVGFGKIKDDASYKYHEHEGVIGWILLVMRLLLLTWFLWAVQSTASEGGMKLQNFIRQFRAAGSMYFLAFPTIFLITRQFAPYLQHKVMQSGLLCMQLGSNVWMMKLFLTRGEYFKVSSLNSSELPGGCRVGMMKEE